MNEGSTSGLGDPSGTRLVCMGNDHCEVLRELSEDTRLTLNQRLCMQFLLDAHDAAPDPVEAIVEWFNLNYYGAADDPDSVRNGADSILAALGVPANPANEEHHAQ